MLRLIISVVACIYAAAVIGEAEGVPCYHCFDSFDINTMSLRSSQKDLLGSKLVRCDKNKNNWNTWLCPAEYPICVIMSGRVKDHVEIIRSCGKNDICRTYNPPPGVILETCRECNTTLCNEYLELSVISPIPLAPSNSPTSVTAPPSATPIPYTISINTTTTTSTTTTTTPSTTTTTTPSTTTTTTPSTTTTTTPSTTTTTTPSTTTTTTPSTTTTTTPSTTTTTTPSTTTTTTTTPSTTTTTTPSTTTTTTPSTTTTTTPTPPAPSPPPVKPNALFKFNININLNVKKHPKINNEYLK